MKRVVAFALLVVFCVGLIGSPHAEAVSNECFVPRNLADFYNKLLPEYAKMAFGGEYNEAIEAIIQSFTVAYSETVDNILYYDSSSGDIEIAALFNSGTPGDSRAADGLYLLGAEQMRGLLMETLCDYLVYYDDSVDGDKLADWLDENNESGGNEEFYGYVVGVVRHDGYFQLSLEKSQTGQSTDKPAADSDTIFCPECGQKIAAGSKFCMYCGHQIPSSPAPSTTPDSSPDSSAVNLDVVQDANGNFALTINGNKLAWGCSIDSAAQFCNQNGLEVEHFYNDINKDAFTLDQNIIFGGTIDVSKAFYIRKAANSSKLQQIDLHNENRCDENTALQSGQRVYHMLQDKFGTPDKGVRLFVNGKWSNFGSDQLSEAVNKLIDSETDYGFVTADYKNLSLNIVRYTNKEGPYYEVYLSLRAVA